MVRPSGATLTQLMPAPQVTAAPHGWAATVGPAPPGPLRGLPSGPGSVPGLPSGPGSVPGLVPGPGSVPGLVPGASDAAGASGGSGSASAASRPARSTANVSLTTSPAADQPSACTSRARSSSSSGRSAPARQAEV